MLSRRTLLGSLTTLFAAGIAPARVLADVTDQKLTSGLPAAKQLLLLMDTDKSGKVSKQEFMNFMEAEFERLDVNKDGELDVHELTQMHRASPNGGHK